MFKSITASIILLAFVTQMFSGQFIRLNYYLNTASFAKNCENKAKPKMHCNGKCQMMKKMQQEEKKDQENTARKYELKINVLSSRSFFYTAIIEYSPLLNKAIGIEKVSPLTDIPYAFFHPPQA